ncbi:hypothetical protein GC093_19700 [Paenibacillus sp. LMG 31456]|uniref:Uncharacterized protein n=1 Tax=Paenibacillus foliorum TaxID=2654974 RepID=A0A972GWF6_9BACL|nr:hypothetical protein [Paenibacillus foliorum]NOU95433.1 hypothetical protein [Paenibacillus foliorum]
MSSLWLTPIVIDEQEQVITLLTDRMELRPVEKADRFLAWLKSVHPRLIVSFKANLMLSDESELACGIDDLPFELSSDEPVVFGQGRLELSHCAQAYLDRLPSNKEMDEWLNSAAVKVVDATEDDIIHLWVNTMLRWHKQGYAIALLKEEN